MEFVGKLRRPRRIGIIRTTCERNCGCSDNGDNARLLVSGWLLFGDHVDLYRRSVMTIRGSSSEEDEVRNRSRVELTDIGT